MRGTIDLQYSVYWSARVNVPTDKGYVLWISLCFEYSDLEHFPLLPKYVKPPHLRYFRRLYAKSSRVLTSLPDQPGQQLPAGRRQRL